MATAAAQTPRELRRQQRFEIGRVQILDAAEDLFAQQGYARTSLEAIATESGFSVGGIYTFFANKGALYAAVMERRGLLMQTRMESWLQRDVRGVEKLIGMVSEVIDTIQEFPAYGRLVLHAVTSSFMPLTDPPGDNKLFASGVAKYATAIEQGQREGDIRDGEPSRLAMLVAGLVMIQAQIDPVIAGDARGIGEAAFLEIVRNALSR